MYMIVTENFSVCLYYYTVHNENKIVSDDTKKDTFLIDVTSMKNVFFLGGGIISLFHLCSSGLYDLLQ
jgi:hypothetical protein